MDGLIGLAEQLDMHGLVMVRPGIDVVEALTIALFEHGVALFGLHGFPVADLGVHGVVCGAAVHADPAQLLFPHPADEVQAGAGVAEHVAALIRLGAIPAILMVAGVDDQDIAFLHLYPLFNIFRGINAPVHSLVGKVYHHAGGAQLGQLQGGHIPACGVKMQGAVQVGAHVVGVGHQLAVGPVGRQPLEEFHLQGLIGGPGGRIDANGDGEFVHFNIRPFAHLRNLLTVICSRNKPAAWMITGRSARNPTQPPGLGGRKGIPSKRGYSSQAFAQASRAWVKQAAGGRTKPAPIWPTP